MKIGILGAGRMGQTLARLFLKAGYEVAMASRHEPRELRALTTELGAGATAVRPGELAAGSGVLVLAVRWPQVPAAVQALGPVTGKVVLDTTNNRVGPRPEDVIDLRGFGSSEVVAGMLVGARVVKIFNNQPIAALAELEPGSAGEKGVFLAGDDQTAKATAAAMVRRIGAIPLDIGGLATGGRLQNTGGPLAGHGRLLDVSEAREQLRQALADQRSIEGDWT